MAAAVISPPSDVDVKEESKPTLTPPASDEADKHDDSGSELSDLDVEPEDNGEIVPDHYYEGGKIPVFKPVRNSATVLIWHNRGACCGPQAPYQVDLELIVVSRS